MTPLPTVMVAPNGARLGKADHPALPITLDEIVDCAVVCHAAGAGGLHLHLRDADGRHLLDAATYRAAISALQKPCPGLLVQATTEAAGIYAPDAQRHVALNAGATHISASVREICGDPGPAPRFYRDCAAAGIQVQHILYDVTDAQLLCSVLSDAALHAPQLQLLFVLGRYADQQQSYPENLDPFLAWMTRMDLRPDWAVCAFGRHETDCLLYAADQGGKCRIGFENSRANRDGSRADSNQDRVAELVGLLARQTPSANPSSDHSQDHIGAGCGEGRERFRPEC